MSEARGEFSGLIGFPREGRVVEPRISLVTLGVSDLDRSVRFYRDGLGWKRSHVSTDEVAFFQLGGLVLALWPRHLLAADAQVEDDRPGFSGVALAQNVRERDDVGRVLAQAGAAGGKVLKPAVDTDWGGHNGYFADPDGFVWEVAWNPYFTLTEDGALLLPESGERGPERTGD